MGAWRTGNAHTRGERTLRNGRGAQLAQRPERSRRGVAQGAHSRGGRSAATLALGHPAPVNRRAVAYLIEGTVRPAVLSQAIHGVLTELAGVRLACVPVRHDAADVAEALLGEALVPSRCWCIGRIVQGAHAGGRRGWWRGRRQRGRAGGPAGRRASHARASAPAHHVGFALCFRGARAGPRLRAALAARTLCHRGRRWTPTAARGAPRSLCHARRAARARACDRGSVRGRCGGRRCSSAELSACALRARPRRGAARGAEPTPRCAAHTHPPGARPWLRTAAPTVVGVGMGKGAHPRRPRTLAPHGARRHTRARARARGRPRPCRLLRACARMYRPPRVPGFAPLRHRVLPSIPCRHASHSTPNRPRHTGVVPPDPAGVKGSGWIRRRWARSRSRCGGCARSGICRRRGRDPG